MKFWKQWNRKLDGWVERRRRFQKPGVERTLERAGVKVEKVAAGLGTTAPASLPDSSKAL